VLCVEIVHYTSPITAPTLFTKNKDESLWLYIEYQHLNKTINKNKDPTSFVDDLDKTMFKSKSIYQIEIHFGFNLVKTSNKNGW
jgi:hypothetical protein